MMHRVVVAALLGPQGILLCRRHPAATAYPGKWDMPGGHIENDESAHQALVRELREELGITVQPTGAGPLFQLSKGSGGPESLFLQGWAVRNWDGVPLNCAPEEHTEIRWFEIRQALTLDLAHDAYVEELAKLLSD